jgi:transcriptional regulator with XRE-family HTH domain
MSLYDRVLARRDGERALAIARLRRTVLATLHEAFSLSGISTQSDLARSLQVRRSAVNQVFNGDGNVRISTLAEYLNVMGYELDIRLVRSGEPRAAALEGRAPRQPELDSNATPAGRECRGRPGVATEMARSVGNAHMLPTERKRLRATANVRL